MMVSQHVVGQFPFRQGSQVIMHAAASSSSVFVSSKHSEINCKCSASVLCGRTCTPTRKELVMVCKAKSNLLGLDGYPSLSTTLKHRLHFLISRKAVVIISLCSAVAFMPHLNVHASLSASTCTILLTSCWYILNSPHAE